MAQKFALKQLLEIAETTAQTAASNLGSLNRALQQHEEKLLLPIRRFINRFRNSDRRHTNIRDCYTHNGELALPLRYTQNARIIQIEFIARQLRKQRRS